MRIGLAVVPVGYGVDGNREKHDISLMMKQEPVPVFSELVTPIQSQIGRKCPNK